jgi:hypothetical protein
MLSNGQHQIGAAFADIALSELRWPPLLPTAVAVTSPAGAATAAGAAPSIAITVVGAPGASAAVAPPPSALATPAVTSAGSYAYASTTAQAAHVISVTQTINVGDVVALFVCGGSTTAASMAVTDTKGNTWDLANNEYQISSSNAPYVAMARVTSQLVGGVDSLTFTFKSSTNGAGTDVTETRVAALLGRVTNPNPSGVLKDTSTGTTGTSATPGPPGSIPAPVQANSVQFQMLRIGLLSGDSADRDKVTSPPTGWTQLGQTNGYTNTSGIQVAVAYRVQTTATAPAATDTWVLDDATHQWRTVIYGLLTTPVFTASNDVAVTAVAGGATAAGPAPTIGLSITAPAAAAPAATGTAVVASSVTATAGAATAASGGAQAPNLTLTSPASSSTAAGVAPLLTLTTSAVAAASTASTGLAVIQWSVSGGAAATAAGLAATFAMTLTSVPAAGAARGLAATLALDLSEPAGTATASGTAPLTHIDGAVFPASAAASATGGTITLSFVVLGLTAGRATASAATGAFTLSLAPLAAAATAAGGDALTLDTGVGAPAGAATATGLGPRLGYTYTPTGHGAARAARSAGGAAVLTHTGGSAAATPANHGQAVTA